MLLAALERPEKVAALVGISTAADHFVTAYNELPVQVRTDLEKTLSSIMHFKPLYDLAAE